MFHFYLSLAYIIPNIYVFFRIMKLFIGKFYRPLFIFVYLLLAAIYPVIGIGYDPDRRLITQMLSTFTGYLLPFYLYLFLSVLLYDLFLLFNRAVRLVKPETRKSYWFRFSVLSAMIVISLLVVVAGVINLNTIRISEYRIDVPRKNARIDHLRVAFVADFHIEGNTSLDFVKQYVIKVNSLNPDLMLYGGDMVEGDHENETTEAIESAFKKIHSKYGAFGVPGNHEFYGGQEQGSFFRKAGITLLCDTMINIDSSFYLAGRYDPHFENRKSINEIIGKGPAGLPLILLDHRPTELQEVSLTDVDVQFSGHTHYGQLFPINLIINGIYDLSWGYRKIKNTHFFVTSGLRLWGPPVKTAGKSEIMLVDIYFR